jgi:transporter family protein
MLIAMNWTMSWTANWICWALLSAVFAAATALLAKVGVAHVDSNLAMALRTTVVVVFAWGIALALGKHGEMRSLDRRTVLFLALSGIATGLSWLCYFRAGRAARQAQRSAGDDLCVAVAGRKTQCRGHRGRRSDYRRGRGDGAGMKRAGTKGTRDQGNKKAGA